MINLILTLRNTHTERYVLNYCGFILQGKFHSFHPVATILSYLTKAPLVSDHTLSKIKKILLSYICISLYTSEPYNNTLGWILNTTKKKNERKVMYLTRLLMKVRESDGTNKVACFPCLINGSLSYSWYHVHMNHEV
jgi:ABC-type dipeptide/oligopeptide/nickel transport system ATPase component